MLRIVETLICPLQISHLTHDAFCSHVFEVRAKGVRLIAMKEVRNHGKIVYIKNIFEMAGGRMHAPHASPWP